MYEILSLSAFQLSFKNHEKTSLYLTEATALQEQALTLFNASNRTINQENVIPAFLFSAVLGLHYFSDSFSSPSPDIDSFLDRLVQSIRILRGVRATMGDSWEYIKQSDISILLHTYEGPVEDRNDHVTHAFENLQVKFSQSHTLSAFESKVYCEAIDRLIWVYNSQPQNSIIDGRQASRIVTTWPITISAEYTELLSERKPEALVVLAYFSILLHGSRSFWAVGDAGRFLLTVIEGYLGEDWGEWLREPRRMVPPL